jgi:hypothetical protein
VAKLLQEIRTSAFLTQGSTLVACAAAVYTKVRGINPLFQWIQTVDIALAASDFGSDVLFIMEAFEVGRESDEQAAVTMGRISFTFLLVSSGVSFAAYLLLLRRYAHRPDSIDNIDWKNIGKHAGWYSVLSLLTSADIELIKLLPWNNATKPFDGFPEMRVAIVITCMALLEDVPQLICQVIFVMTIAPSYVAYMSIAITVLSMCWRVAKRSLRLMAAAHAMALDSQTHPTALVSAVAVSPAAHRMKGVPMGVVVVGEALRV